MKIVISPTPEIFRKLQYYLDKNNIKYKIIEDQHIKILER